MSRRDDGAICCACGLTRSLSSLIRVTDRASGRARYVCRPSLPQPVRRPCFGARVRTADLDAIELAERERETASERAAKRARERATVARLATGLMEQEAALALAAVSA